MDWYSIDMPEASLTDGAYHRLCRAFQRAFIGAGAPPGMALFARRSNSTDVRTLYVSPESRNYVAELLRDHDARPCSVPDPIGLTLVYGVPEAGRSLLAPQADEDPRAARRPAVLPILQAPSLASSG